MEADTQERLESARAAANTAAHVDACLPTAWVPPELAIPPVERVHPLEWQDTFTDLVYRLHGILHASVVSMDWDDFPKARLLFQLADAVRAPLPPLHPPPPTFLRCTGLASQCLCRIKGGKKNCGQMAAAASQ